MLDRFRRKASQWVVKSLGDLFPELKNLIHVFSSIGDSSESAIKFPIAPPSTAHQTSAWVYKAVEVWKRLLSPLVLQVVDEEGRPVKKHPLQKSLRLLNPDYPNSDLWARWAHNMALYGECAFEVKYSGLRISEVWALEPEDFRVDPDLTQRQHRRIASYKVYRPGVFRYGLAKAECVFWKFWNPLDPYRGLAPLTAVRSVVINDQLAVAWQHFFFKNFAMPGTAIYSKSGMTPSERKALEETFAKRFGMTADDWNIFKPVVLEDQITDIKTFSTPPKDIAWLDQRGINREEIAAVFGISPEMMGFGRKTYENYDVSEQVVWTLTMLPLIFFRDEHLTHFLQQTGQLSVLEFVRTDLSKVYALRRVLDPLFRQGHYFSQWGAPFAKINEYFNLGFPAFAGDDVSHPRGSGVSIAPTGSIDPGQPDLVITDEADHATT